MFTINTKCFISCSTDDLDKAEQISRFLKEESIDATTGKDLFLQGMTITENLQNAIAKVDFVILMIPSEHTLKEQPRENLFFEMGIIIGMGVPLLTLVEKEARIHLPSDLSSVMYLNYDAKKIEASFRYIRNWIAHSLQKTF